MFVIEASQLMLYREIIAVCSQIHTKHINTLCGQNVELLNVKLVVHIVTTGLQRVNNLLPFCCWCLCYTVYVIYNSVSWEEIFDISGLFGCEQGLCYSTKRTHYISRPTTALTGHTASADPQQH